MSKLEKTSGKANIDVIMFATTHLDIYTKLSIPAWKKYCEHFGYNFHHYGESYYENLHLAWSKIRSVREHLGSTSAPYILMVDADTIPTSFDVSVEQLLKQFMKEGKRILFQKDGSTKLGFLYFTHNFKLTFGAKRWTLPNAGFILQENTPEVRAFYDEWLERAETSPWANILPRNQNVLAREMLNRKELDQMTGYIDTWVVNKFRGKLCQHFSSKSKEDIARLMQPHHDRIMKE